MTIATYAELQTEIEGYLDDATLAESVATFVKLAEARFNRVLRVSEMETLDTLAVSAERTALPADYAGLRSIQIEGSPDRPLEQMELGALRRRFANMGAGKPVAYAISAGQIVWGPAPDGEYEAEIVYYAKLPPLADNSTNWLLELHPDAYLYGALIQAEFKGWNDGRLPLIKAALDETLAEMDVDSERRKWGAAPLVPQMAVLG